MRNIARAIVSSAIALVLTSCGQQPAADTSEPGTPASQAFAWPAALSPFGDGYPNAGDPCRRLGESALTSDFLDDSAVLVGCPEAAGDDARAALLAVGGKTVGEAMGIVMISIPQGDANAGMAAAAPAEIEQ